MRPISVVSSANFRSLTEGSLDVQSLVYREKSSGERTQPWGAPVLIVRVLDENFPSLTSCCLSVRKLLIHWQTEVGMESWVSLGRRRFGMIVLKAELKSTNRILVCLDVAEHNAVPCWLRRPQTCLLCRQTEEDPARVQWCPSGGPAPVFQKTSWPQTLQPQACSHLVL